MASEATARAEAQRLKAILERYYRGTRFRVSIELQKGRGDWYVPKYLRMHHHVATRFPKPGGNLTPGLGVVKTGRPDVGGPLANGYGGYDLVYRLICMGLANHPGRGGPIVIDGVKVPKDSARPATWGTEWEGGYEDWPDEFDQFMALTDLALAEWMGRPVTSQLEHKTWAPTRKVDRFGFDRERGIALSRKYAALATATQPANTPPIPGVSMDDATLIQHLKNLKDQTIAGVRADLVNLKAQILAETQLLLAADKDGVALLVRGTGEGYDPDNPDHVAHVRKWFLFDGMEKRHVESVEDANHMIMGGQARALPNNQPFPWPQNLLDNYDEVGAVSPPAGS